MLHYVALPILNMYNRKAQKNKNKGKRSGQSPAEIYRMEKKWKEELEQYQEVFADQLFVKEII